MTFSFSIYLDSRKERTNILVCTYINNIKGTWCTKERYPEKDILGSFQGQITSYSRRPRHTGMSLHVDSRRGQVYVSFL